MPKLDLNKPLRRVGINLPARVICTDRKNPYNTPIIVLVEDSAGCEYTLAVDRSGRDYSGHTLLENVPESNKFRNLYKEQIGFATDRYSLAEAQATANRGSTYGWVGTLEETREGEFVAFHPRPKGD